MSERVCRGCGAPLPPKSWTGRDRVWCSARCRKASYGDPCVDCGARTSYGAEAARVAEPRCDRCARGRQMAAARIVDAEVVRLRAQGLLNHEIAERLGTSAKSVTARVFRLRERGVEVSETAYAPAKARSGLR